MEKNALVVGLGIAGMASAIGLRKAGWNVTIIERSDRRRTGGYFVGLFPEGIDAAARLGVLDAIGIDARSVRDSRTWEVDAAGRRHRSAGFLDDPKRPVGVLRSDIEASLWETVDNTIDDIRFGVIPAAISFGPAGQAVTLRDTSTGGEREEEFDLIVGADGLRSTVRAHAFADHETCIQQWKSMICAFELDDQVPGYADRDALVFAEPGRAFWVFPYEDHNPTGLFIFRTDDIDTQLRIGRDAALEGAFGDVSVPEVQYGLAQARTTEFSLFDSTGIVDIPEWRRSRTILMGDAAWCLTLYSGMGATSAMLGGAVLGEWVARESDLDRALTGWEQEMRAFIRRQRLIARIKYEIFVPSNRFRAVLRSGMLRAAGRTVAPIAARNRVRNALS